MRKRHVVVGVVMLLASAVSYGLVQMTEASAAFEVVASATPMMNLASAPAPLVTPSPAAGFGGVLGSISDTTMMFAIGAALIGIAAGVRRHSGQ